METVSNRNVVAVAAYIDNQPSVQVPFTSGSGCSHQLGPVTFDVTGPLAYTVPITDHPNGYHHDLEHCRA
jgi:hypothetical protein